MSVHATKLDKGARRAIFLAVALLLAGPVILVAKYVIAELREQQTIVYPQDDQLVVLDDGSTMVASRGSTARIVADWLNEDAAGGRTFEVGNENFTAGTATLTSEGWGNLAQFSHMLKAHHEVNALVLYSAHHGIRATLDLQHRRADRIQEEAIKQGVHEEQIAVSMEAFEAGHDPARDEGLEIVLTNKA